MKIPLRNGTEFDLAPFIDGFKAKYPHVDMASELAKMHLWLHRNPASQPIAPFKFVDNWLKKLKPKQAQLRIVGGAKMTEHEVLALAQSMNVLPRPGESYPQLARRLALIADQKRMEA